MKTNGQKYWKCHEFFNYRPEGLILRTQERIRRFRLKIQTKEGDDEKISTASRKTQANN